MAAAPMSLCLPWAVHISDGVLSAPWLAGGFVIAGLLSLLASYRVRDEEIPRIALLSAAFFVASLMHLRLGPTSVHLLLNGLVGVVLGRRAPLAILIGLGLQAALLGHGGFTTIGVNACVLTLPALLAGWLFAGLHRLPGVRPGRRLLIWIVGCLIGMVSVFVTLILQAAVLLWGGAEDWHPIVWLVFYAHLPIVAVEGVVLGFTVSFLARVKPEMLGVSNATLRKWRMPSPPDREAIRRPLPSHLPALLLAALTTLIAAGPAHAHRLDAAFRVLPEKHVRIESWFDLGGIPKGAKVEIFRPGEHLLAEGRLDEQGHFVFPYLDAEDLKVIVSAGAGHRKEFVIPGEKLKQSGIAPPSDDDLLERAGSDMSRTIVPAEEYRERLKEAIVGISFLLALAAFVLSWRNGRKLKSIQEIQSNPTGERPG